MFALLGYYNRSTAQPKAIITGTAIIIIRYGSRNTSVRTIYIEINLRILPMRQSPLQHSVLNQYS